MKVVVGHFYSDSVENAEKVKDLFEDANYEIAFENESITNFVVIEERLDANE